MSDNKENNFGNNEFPQNDNLTENGSIQDSLLDEGANSTDEVKNLDSENKDVISEESFDAHKNDSNSFAENDGLYSYSKKDLHEKGIPEDEFTSGDKDKAFATEEYSSECEGNENGMSEENQNGYNQGTQNLWSQENQNGYNQGNQNGWNQGNQNGWNQGNQNGWIQGNQNGWNQGNQNGWNQGNQNGWNQGNQNGWNQGNQNGWNQGNQNGYNQGNQNGWNQGNQNGWNQGNQNGWNQGNQNGWNQGNQNGWNQGNQNGWNQGNPNGWNQGNQNGWNQGNQNGWNQGNQNGYNQGNQNGWNQGNQNGWNQGNQNGWNQGNQNGWNQGNQNGWNQGNQNGYNQGTQNGWNQGNQNGWNQGNPNDDDNNLEIPPVKKGKWFLWIIVGVMAVLSIVSLYFLIDYLGTGTWDDNSNINNSQTLPDHDYTDVVIEHVKPSEPSEEYFTDKTALYDYAQKSCVTVVCGKKGYDNTVTSVSLGSGFVVSKDGYIVTNAHVVDGASIFKVRFYGGGEADALLIGKDTDCDIAVIKIRTDENLVPVSFGDSTKVRVGDFAIAIGTPSGEELYGSMTFGVISGKERKVFIKNSAGQTVRTMMFLQTDATLNPGNSGGPLFNMYGQVIGINTMKLKNDYEGMGFAIPSAGAAKIINSLISTGKADYSDSDYVKGGAQLGIRGITLDESNKRKCGFSEDDPDGVLISSIERDSSAYKAGVSGNDVICAFNGKEIKTFEQLIGEIGKCSPGDEVTLKVYRVRRNEKEGDYFTYKFTLDEVEEE